MEIEPDSPTFHLVKVAYQVFNKQDIEEEVEKEMGTHSSILAWRIPGTEEPGGLPFMGSHRVRHDWSDLAAAAAEEKKSEDKKAQRPTYWLLLSDVSQRENLD